MKRAFALSAVVLVTLAACRGVVGIEDQTVGDAGTATTGDAGGAKDTGAADATADARAKPPVTPECQNFQGGDCIKCCRDRANTQGQPVANMVFDQYLSSDCACQGPAICKNDCVNDLCAGRPPGDAGSPCITCITAATLSATCQPALDNCIANTSCSIIATCIEGTCK